VAKASWIRYIHAALWPPLVWKRKSGMLNALITLATTGISEATSFDIAGFNAVHHHAVNPLMMPEEPTTLTLALIGAGLLAGYAVINRVRRQQQPVIAAFPTAKTPTSPQRSKRGAA
jgi:hypothetical protein